MDAQRSRTPLVLGIVGALACLGLVMVLVIAGLVLVVVTSGEEEEPRTGSSPVATADKGERDDDPDGGGADGTDPESSAPGSGAPTEETAAPDDLTLPPGVAADQPYLELSTSDDGPVVDVYVDFLCPHCKTFQEVQGDDLLQMALDSQITLRVHPRPMLDSTSDPVGYSDRAAHAAVCAYAENPEKWFPAEIALFENQPGTEGLTDAELIDLVNTATDLDISACQTEGAYHSWLQNVVEPDGLENASGTPTVLIDGEPFAGDLGQAGAVKAAVEAA